MEPVAWTVRDIAARTDDGEAALRGTATSQLHVLLVSSSSELATEAPAGDLDEARLAIAFSLARVKDGLLGPVQGWLLDRFGPRTVMRVGILIFCRGLRWLQPDQLAAALLCHFCL
jgi:hypothetical protein